MWCHHSDACDDDDDDDDNDGKDDNDDDDDNSDLEDESYGHSSYCHIDDKLGLGLGIICVTDIVTIPLFSTANCAYIHIYS